MELGATSGHRPLDSRVSDSRSQGEAPQPPSTTPDGDLSMRVLLPRRRLLRSPAKAQWIPVASLIAVVVVLSFCLHLRGTKQLSLSGVTARRLAAGEGGGGGRKRKADLYLSHSCFSEDEEEGDPQQQSAAGGAPVECQEAEDQVDDQPSPKSRRTDLSPCLDTPGNPFDYSPPPVVDQVDLGDLEALPHLGGSLVEDVLGASDASPSGGEGGQAEDLWPESPVDVSPPPLGFDLDGLLDLADDCRGSSPCREVSEEEGRAGPSSRLEEPIVISSDDDVISISSSSEDEHPPPQQTAKASDTSRFQQFAANPLAFPHAGVTSGLLPEGDSDFNLSPNDLILMAMALADEHPSQGQSENQTAAGGDFTSAGTSSSTDSQVSTSHGNSWYVPPPYETTTNTPNFQDPNFGLTVDDLVAVALALVDSPPPSPPPQEEGEHHGGNGGN
ncbi:hypothetical protein Esti_005586 [Eimeria stiedai]